MRITIHQLRVFECVARVGSVTQAAHELHMSQPAVSNIIRHIEGYYGCAVIEIISRKLTLTAFGKVILEGGRQLQSALDNIQSSIDLLKGGMSGTLHVAIVSTAQYFVPRLMGLFKTTYPGIHVKLVVCNRHNIIARLKENLDDITIMSHPPKSMLVDCAEFYDDELIVAASVDYLATNKNQSEIKLSDLDDASWIIREEGSGTRYATENIFKERDFSPNIRMEISDSEAIKQAIMANIGISVISKQSVKCELKFNLIYELPVENFPVKHTWFLVKNKGKTLSPIAASFYSFTIDRKSEFKNIY